MGECAVDDVRMQEVVGRQEESGRESSLLESGVGGRVQEARRVEKGGVTAGGVIEDGLVESRGDDAVI
jgi:hypothetical protein